MKRYWPHLLLVAGTVLAMLSIGLDLVQMASGWSGTADPESIRGYESVHGSVTFTIATLLLVASLLTMWERSRRARVGRPIAIAMGLGAVGIAIIYWTSEPLLIAIVAVAAAAVVWAAIAAGPASLAATRMLLFSTAAGAIAVAASGGASRNDLLSEQLSASGAAAQYGDTELAIGFYVALLGLLSALAGAVGLWRQRTEGSRLAGSTAP